MKKVLIFKRNIVYYSDIVNEGFNKENKGIICLKRVA